MVKGWHLVAIVDIAGTFHTLWPLCSNTSATSCEELTHWKRPWCWEGLGAGGEGDDRGWDGWMASPTRWAWVWVNSGSWWWTGRPGVLWFMGSQRVRRDWATELNWTELNWTELTSLLGSLPVDFIYLEGLFSNMKSFPSALPLLDLIITLWQMDSKYMYLSINDLLTINTVPRIWFILVKS